MSYDIRFAVKVEDTGIYAVIGEPEYSSPTYNVGTIFRKSMDWNFSQEVFYKVTDILPKIERGIHELSFNSQKYKKYEPDNGWGSTDSALNALKSIMQYLTETLKSSWNCDIPLENLYMCW